MKLVYNKSTKSFSERGITKISFEFDSKGDFPKFHDKFMKEIAPYTWERIGLSPGESIDFDEFVTESRDSKSWDVLVRADQKDDFLKKLKSINGIKVGKIKSFSGSKSPSGVDEVNRFRNF